ncbi:MAG TPA: ABC transporter ATP-binding protein [Planctomycetota bacterium]|nr:ABC transporter ATP-binding protein [Planctomycetota bacterium]
MSLPEDLALRAQALTKHYRTREVSHAAGNRRGWRTVEALAGVSLDVARGECVAVVGSNGAGKTTLLRLLMGVLVPTGGEVSIRTPVVGMLGAAASFHPDLSARENAILSGAFQGIRRRHMQPRIPDLLAFADLTEAADVPVRYFSDGMRVRLAFALALDFPQAVLLGDEALAAADARFRATVETALRRRVEGGGAVVLASHDPATVRNLASRTVWLAEGRIRRDGPTLEVLEAYLATSERHPSS